MNVKVDYFRGSGVRALPFKHGDTTLVHEFVPGINEVPEQVLVGIAEQPQLRPLFEGPAAIFRIAEEVAEGEPVEDALSVEADDAPEPPAGEVVAQDGGEPQGESKKDEGTA